MGGAPRAVTHPPAALTLPPPLLTVLLGLALLPTVGPQLNPRSWWLGQLCPHPARCCLGILALGVSCSPPWGSTLGDQPASDLWDGVKVKVPASAPDLFTLSLLPPLSSPLHLITTSYVPGKEDDNIYSRVAICRA